MVISQIPLKSYGWQKLAWVKLLNCILATKNIPLLIPRELRMLPGMKQVVFIGRKSNSFWNKKVFKWQTEK